MGFYDDINNVNQYLEMAAGYDAKQLTCTFAKYLKPDDSILELGSGPGKDYDLLSQTYDVTASDASTVFVELLKAKYPDGKVLELDAVSIETNRAYDAVFSNKVLQHLSKEDLKASIISQSHVLSEDGILFHSFWYGSGEETFDGLRFVYYDEKELQNLFEAYFDILDMKRYSEMEEDDSIYIVAKRKKN